METQSQRGQKNCLWPFWKFKWILIWTIRYGDKAVLKHLPILVLLPLFPNFGRTRFFLKIRFAPECRVPSYLLFKHGLDTKSMVRFFVKCEKPPEITFSPHFPKFWENQIFPKKSKIVIFLHLSFNNFMQKIRKILRSNSREMPERMDARTHAREFIGPSR